LGVSFHGSNKKARILRAEKIIYRFCVLPPQPDSGFLFFDFSNKFNMMQWLQNSTPGCDNPKLTTCDNAKLTTPRVDIQV
jgi:hypothetical protein